MSGLQTNQMRCASHFAPCRGDCRQTVSHLLILFRWMQGVQFGLDGNTLGTTYDPQYFSTRIADFAPFCLGAHSLPAAGQLRRACEYHYHRDFERFPEPHLCRHHLASRLS